MAERPQDPELSDEMHSLRESSRSNSEAFSIIGTELTEVKAMLTRATGANSSRDSKAA